MLGNAQLAEGRVAAGPASGFVGRMSDVTVWSRVLPALEIQVARLCMKLEEVGWAGGWVMKETELEKL